MLTQYVETTVMLGSAHHVRGRITTIISWCAERTNNRCCCNRSTAFLEPKNTRMPKCDRPIWTKTSTQKTRRYQSATHIDKKYLAGCALASRSFFLAHACAHRVDVLSSAENTIKPVRLRRIRRRFARRVRRLQRARGGAEEHGRDDVLPSGCRRKW